MSEHNPGEPDFGHDEDAQHNPGEPSFEDGEGVDDASPEAIENDPSANPPDEGLKDLKGG